MRTRWPATVAIVLALAVSAPASGQGFGSAVAAGEDEVLVLEPTSGRGPAEVVVYRRVGGSWEAVDRLRPPGAVGTGEGYSASLALVGGDLLVGSGDPGVRWAAQAFRRRDGAWQAADRIALDPTRSPAPEATTLDLASLMRIMEPPERIVAADGDVALGGIGGGRLADVRVLERSAGDGGWRSTVTLVDSAADLAGTSVEALSLRGNVAAVGAPQSSDAGSVIVLERAAAGGGWRVIATLGTDGSARRLGAALAFDGEALLVGAPGADSIVGAVLRFGRDEASGLWVEQGRITSPASPGDGFGSSLAVFGDELWVGAPRTAGGRGAIYRYRRAGAAAWVPERGGPLQGRSDWAPSGLGTSIALAPTLAVVGAPWARFGKGSAALFEREAGGGWGAPIWLVQDEELTAVTGDEVRCDEGKAGAFACENVDLLAFLPIDALGGAGGESVSDVWGWTDQVTGREYALVGRTGGASVVDVSDPVAPLYLGTVEANPSGARDLKVYRDHLFFTGDGAGDHGLVVFDLTRLRDVDEPPVAFRPDTVYHGIASAHNLVIDTDAGFAYPVGASGGGQTCGGGLHMIDIRTPERPTFAGCYTDTEGLIWQGRTHDAQCVVYRGPDEAYRGRQICFASNETALRIVDVTDKERPEPISRATYPGLSYVHQGWLTEDQRYFYMNDELDELTGNADRTRTLVWDVAELDDPLLVGELFGPTGATDHNLYVVGNRMYQANYNAGLQVWDVSDPEHAVPIGSFDTTPWEGDPPGFHGAWTAYPFFESGTVVVTSIGEGLFLLRPRIILP